MENYNNTVPVHSVKIGNEIDAEMNFRYGPFNVIQDTGEKEFKFYFLLYLRFLFLYFGSD